ncbi:MAG: hypothetical protein ACJA0U_001138 [Salibacteraceae bacterium]|jgi:hypothetical protein
MKKILILLSLIILSSSHAVSQDDDGCQMTALIAGGGKNIQIVGAESSLFIESLFAEFPDTKRKGYKWKFKNVVVPGLDKPVTFQVHQGLSGRNENGTGYFNTFMDDKYKKMRLAQNIETENPAVIIYVKRGRNHVIKTDEEDKLVREYLLSIASNS